MLVCSTGLSVHAGGLYHILCRLMLSNQLRYCSRRLWGNLGNCCRLGLKAELGAFYPLLLLRPLEAERPEPGQVYAALEALQELSMQPQLLVRVALSLCDRCLTLCINAICMHSCDMQMRLQLMWLLSHTVPLSCCHGEIRHGAGKGINIIACTACLLVRMLKSLQC